MFMLHFSWQSSSSVKILWHSKIHPKVLILSIGCEWSWLRIEAPWWSPKTQSEHVGLEEDFSSSSGVSSQVPYGFMLIFQSVVFLLLMENMRRMGKEADNISMPQKKRWSVPICFQGEFFFLTNTSFFKYDLLISQMVSNKLWKKGHSKRWSKTKRGFFPLEPTATRTPRLGISPIITSGGMDDEKNWTTEINKNFRIDNRWWILMDDECALMSSVLSLQSPMSWYKYTLHIVFDRSFPSFNRSVLHSQAGSCSSWLDHAT